MEAIGIMATIYFVFWLIGLSVKSKKEEKSLKFLKQLEAKKLQESYHLMTDEEFYWSGLSDSTLKAELWKELSELSGDDDATWNRRTTLLIKLIDIGEI